MARGEQLLRQWNLLKMLQTRGDGLPLAQLATELEVTERTIQRDFEMLQEMGFPVEYAEDESKKRFWKLPHDFFRVGPLVLSHTEAMSLVLAEQLFEPIAGTHLAEGLQSVMDKIRSCIPRQALDHFADVDTLTYIPKFGRTDHGPHADKIHALIEAAQKQQTVKVSYQPLWDAGAFATFFDPYGLVLFDGNLFALGFSHHSKSMRVLKVVRICEVQPSHYTFEPADINIRRHFEHSFGIVQGSGEPITIVVKFTGKAATLVGERIWHDSQQLVWLAPEATLFEPVSNQPDALLATFRLAETGVFKGWLKGFGAHAEVLEPVSLRRELRDELLAAAQVYAE